MDALLDQHFHRVEAALNALIDSITSYNPSHQAVLDLVAADDELSRGLEQLAAHQANYQRILALRQTADTLDAQVKSTLTTLAETRKELINTPASTTVANSRDVSTQELLAYAKHIGKFTVPPNYRPPPTKEEAAVQANPDEDVVMTNGTPATAAPQQQQQPDGTAAPEETRTMATLSAEQKTWLAGLSALPFVPWPTEDKIRLGALGQIQTMVEQGRDPTTVLSPEEQAERARKAAEEEEERRKEEERQRAEVERKRRESYAAGGGQGGAQSQAEPPPAVFSLDLY